MRVRPLLVALSALAALSSAAPARAQSGNTAPAIPVNLDVNRLRSRLGPNEGLLHMIDGGEERTGWVDVRMPALDGTRDGVRGYDWSDNQVTVLTHNVTAPAGASTVTGALRGQDFDISNAIYAQAGITVRQEGNVNINGNNIVNNGMGNPEPSLSQLFGNGRSANANTVNAYYVRTIPNNFGYALPPTYAQRGGFANSGNNNNAVPPGTPVFNNGLAVADTSRTLPNGGSSTFAHELGHVLLDTNRFAPSPAFHSAAADDLMNVAPIDPNPAANKEAGRFGFTEAGQRVGNIGTTGHLGRDVTPIGGGAGTTTSQIDAMNASPYVRHFDNVGAGDRADFSWVEDNIPLELSGRNGNATRADNHPPVDFMVWTIAGLAAPNNAGHDTGNWLTNLNRPEPGLGAFGGPFFDHVDVLSIIGRYSDQDTDAGGNWSRRESALDYYVQFSADGTNWVDGTVERVFDRGWNPRSTADDYVARWVTDIHATFLRIAGRPLGGNYDGNGQIDAVIASFGTQSVPEPATLVLAGAGALFAVGFGRLRRRRSA